MASERERPTGDDPVAWSEYWGNLGQSWRTQPEIDPTRQEYLTERRTIQPDLVQGMYPFRGVALTRADVEWLLAAHDSGLGYIGPIIWADEEGPSHDSRRGLDLRGALLDDVDLSGLPLAELVAMLLLSEKNVVMDAVSSSDEATEIIWRAQTHFERASFRGAHLEGAFLVECLMSGADFSGANLTRTVLYGGRLTGATFVGARMRGANLMEVRGDDTDFHDAILDGAVFSISDLRRANFANASLIPLDPFPESRRQRGLTPEVALDNCHLEGANFTNALMYGADLTGAYLDGALLDGAHLDGAKMAKIRVSSEALKKATIAPSLADATQQEWAAKGQPWRKHPEIDSTRQAELRELLRRPDDEAAHSFPLTGAALTRADVEWLLAMHEDGRGPVDWQDAAQRERWGIDLRGANLQGVDLQGLPLARARAGFRLAPSHDAPPRSELAGRTNLSRANLSYAHLEGADLTGADLEQARLDWARLDHANLSNARLEVLSARWAHFEHANFFNASLSGTFDDAHLEHAQAMASRFIGAQMKTAHLQDADFTGARLRDVNLSGAFLDGARCRQTVFLNLDVGPLSPTRWPSNLEGASLVSVDFTDARLDECALQGATLHNAILAGARLDSADLTSATLAGADLRRSAFTPRTRLDGAMFGDKRHGPARVAGVIWGGVDMSGVAWKRLPILGDEVAARTRRDASGRKLSHAERLLRYQEAVRANAQLAGALTQNGLNELAAPYAYRARVLQRKTLLRQIIWRGEVSRCGPYLLTSLLGLLTGYGYRVGRILIAYLLLVTAFAVALFALGKSPGHPIAPQDALLISLTAFHGRVFSDQFTPNSAQTWITAIEAIVGLVIESVFIAMLTQRFFGR